MSSSSNNTFEAILKWSIVIILAIVALKVVAAVLNIAFFVGWVLLWKVIPLVVVAWLILKAIEWLRGKNGDSATSSSTLDI